MIPAPAAHNLSVPDFINDICEREEVVSLTHNRRDPDANKKRLLGFSFSLLPPPRGGGGAKHIENRGRLGGRARAGGALRGKAAAADQEAGYGSLHAP